VKGNVTKCGVNRELRKLKADLEKVGRHKLWWLKFEDPVSGKM
jgi:hypothetical protein